jgi:hypothetical protein
MRRIIFLAIFMIATLLGANTSVLAQGTATSSTHLVSSLNPSAHGSAVTFTATVSGGSGVPTGNVFFSDNGSNLAGFGLDASGNASITVSSLSAGTHTITASYGGDSVYAASSGTTSQMVTTNQLTITISTSGSNFTYGEAAPDVFMTISGGAHHGTMHYYFDDTEAANQFPFTQDTGRFPGQVLPAGTHQLTVRFTSDDGNTDAAVSNAVPVTIAPAASQVLLSSSPNPSVEGNSAQIQALITPIGPQNGVNASGTVNLSEGSIDYGTYPVNTVTRTAIINLSTLTVGSHSITASYSGDNNYLPSTATFVQQVNSPRVGTSTSLSVVPSAAVYNQPVTLNAQVSPSLNVGGTVTFLDGGQSLGTVHISSGFATLTLLSGLPVGAHSIVAAYGGDSGHDPSNSVACILPVDLALPNGSVSAPLTAVTNQQVGFSLSLQPIYGGTPTGSVLVSEGANTLGTFPLTNSACAFTLSFASPGRHIITCQYSGDSNYSSSTFTTSLDVSLATTSTALTFSPSNPIYNQTITFTAAVTSLQVPSVLGGSVVFIDSVSGVLGTTPVVNGTATLQVPSLNVGSHSITAQYSGAGLYQDSTTSTNVTVAPALAVISLSNLDQTYDRTPKAATAVTTPAGVPVNITYNGSATPPVNAGTYIVVATSSDPDYSGSVSSTLVIKKALLTVTADSKIKSLNAVNPQLTGSLVGVAPGDNIGISFSTTATSSSWVGSYPITSVLSDPGGRLSNYNVVRTDGVLTIVFGSTSGVEAPLRADGSSSYHLGQSVRVSFEVFDANHNSVTLAGTVSDIRLTAINGVNVNIVPVTSSLDLHGKKWSFLIDTSNLTLGSVYGYTLTLADGSVIRFQFSIR